MNDKILKIAEKLKQREEKKNSVKEKYKLLGKSKKLTTEQRLARLEELLGIE